MIKKGLGMYVLYWFGAGLDEEEKFIYVIPAEVFTSYSVGSPNI